LSDCADRRAHIKQQWPFHTGHWSASNRPRIPQAYCDPGQQEL